MIKCDFVKISESCVYKKPLRVGRYHHSVYPISTLNTKLFLVAFYLKVDEASSEKNKKLTEKEILEGCIEFLNQPLPMKKKAKIVKYKYGFLKLFSYKFLPSKNAYCVLATTNENKNRHFWL